jgi:putative ABC transport system permease protein
MLRNYFKTAWRNLWKNKVYTAINIAGLAIGMAACIVIMLFVFYEKSFDNMHKKNLYRLNEVQKFPGMVASQKVALSMFPMGPTMKAKFPQILQYTRVNWHDKFQVTYKDKRLFLPMAFMVDSTFLNLFDFPLLRSEGSVARPGSNGIIRTTAAAGKPGEVDRLAVLEKPNSIVLTESAARKIFGDEDPIGKTIMHYDEDTLVFKVTGIVADVPQNSQLQFDALMSFNTVYRPNWMNFWGGNWLDTYFELAPNTDIAALERKFPAYLKDHLKEDNWKYYELFLLPLKDVHAHTADIGLDYVNYQKFDAKYTNIFSIIALVVLAIACINFMNLSTARAAERAREVGIRKAIGAQRSQLSQQFLSETVLLAIIALAIAVGLVAFLGLPQAEKLSGRELGTVLRQNVWIPLLIAGCAILVGFISGLYPAAYLSSFQPVKVLKGVPQIGNNKSLLRNILVIGQFTSAIFLIVVTIFVFRQLIFMRQKDPGFERDRVLTVSLNGMTSRKYDLLKQTLLGNASISAVTAAQDQLGSHLDQSGVEFKGSGPMRDLTGTRLIVDPDYLRLYKIRLVAGRDFTNEKQANGREYIINEAMAEELNKDEPPKQPISALIGKHFGFDSAGTIVGIAKNFNFNSLHNKIETLFLFNQKEWGFSTLSVKIKGGRTDEAVDHIRKAWSNIYPGYPFEYQFLDDHFKEVYQADEQVTKIVGALAGLAIFISCLGLFGLAAYAAERRVKEIGIRKVIGASVGNIVRLLSVQFVWLVLGSIVLAWPAAWLVMHLWLENYAYRIDLSWWVFVLAGVIALCIALGTVSIMAVGAAMANPVESLRSE